MLQDHFFIANSTHILRLAMSYGYGPWIVTGNETSGLIQEPKNEGDASMGKGDRRTKRGKIWRNSSGNCRIKKQKKGKAKK